jgi:hypothetical protein
MRAQHKQLILLPVAFQSLCDLLLASLHSAIPIPRHFPGVAFPIQNRLQDGLPGHPGDVADHVGQLDIHLRQRLLHPLNMTTEYSAPDPGAVASIRDCVSFAARAGQVEFNQRRLA